MTIFHASPSAARPAILYVEDDRTMRHVITLFFERYLPWADLYPAGSISEALQIVSGLETPLSAVVSDGYLAGAFNRDQTAVQLQEQLDSALPKASVPFLVLTGNPRDFPDAHFPRPPLVVAEKGGTDGPHMIVRRLQEHLRPHVPWPSA